MFNVLKMHPQIKWQFSLYVSQITDRLHYRDQQVESFREEIDVKCGINSSLKHTMLQDAEFL